MTTTDTKKPGLICARCGAPISTSFELGRCYAEECVPAEMTVHDEAITSVPFVGLDDDDRAGLAVADRMRADRQKRGAS